MDLRILLMPYKSSETADSAVVLLEDREAQKLVAFWPNELATARTPIV